MGLFEYVEPNKPMTTEELQRASLPEQTIFFGCICSTNAIDNDLLPDTDL